MKNQDVIKAIVRIGTVQGTGTGFYLKDSNIIVTNYHVVGNNRSVSIENQNKESLVGEVVFVNPVDDIAFLTPSEKMDVPELKLASGESLQSSQKVSVLGYPYGLPFTVTEGIISAPQQVMNGRQYIQTDAAVNPGNSGGPLVNDNGHIIGITTCKFQHADNVGFAIPICDLMEDLKAWLERGSEQEYSVKCPSCDFLLQKKVEYCPNCGDDLSQSKIFDTVQLSPLATFVEESLKNLGIDPILARKGFDFWEFYQGSALIRVFVYRNNYLYITSPLVTLPKQNLEKLYRYILSDEVSPYRYGIDQDIIYLSYRIDMEEINGPRREKIQKIFSSLAEKADEMDNYLVEEFSCEPSGFSKDL